MKKITLSLCLLFCSLFTYGQSNDFKWMQIVHDANNFINIADSFQTFILAEYSDSIPKEKLPNIKDYYRYYKFWKSRLSYEQGNASHDTYLQATNSLNNSGGYCNQQDLANWELHGPATLPCQNLGLVSEVLGNPSNPNDIILSSEHGGLWKYQTTGNTWINVTDNLFLPGISATSIIRHPGNPNHLFASTGSGVHTTNYGVGIIESLDNGYNWNIMNSFPNQSAPYLVKLIYDPNDIDFTDGLTMYAIGFDKIFKTLNTGVSWEELTSNSPSFFSSINMQGKQFHDIKVLENGKLIVSLRARWDGINGKVIIYDEFNGWQDISSIIRPDAPFQKARFSTPSNGKVFALIDYDNGNVDKHRRIYKSVDNAQSWTQVNILNEVPSEKDEIEYFPTGNSSNGFVLLGGVHLKCFKESNPSVSKSYASEMSCIPNSPFYHADVRDFYYMGTDNDGKEMVLFANDGGITLFKIDASNYSNYSFTNLNGNHLPISNLNGMAVTNNSNEFILAGAVHCNTFKFQNGNWSSFSGGDGGDCEINWLDTRIYYNMNNGSIQRSGSTIHSFSSGYWFIGMEFELSPINPYKLYFGGREQLVIYEEGIGKSIKPAPEGLTNVGAIGINNREDIYIADFSFANFNVNGRFAKSTDGGNSWTDLSNTKVPLSTSPDSLTLRQVLAWKTIEDIIFNPNDPLEVWISIGGLFSENNQPIGEKFRVLHSVDGGKSWTDYSKGLPAFPVMALEYQLGSNNRLFAGTDAGVYYRTPEMTKWECFSSGLPISIITDLDYEPCSNSLYASTYSRGVFKTALPLSFNPTTPIVINSNTEWSLQKVVNQNIIIETGATLIITNSVFMGGNTKIIVKRGGTLKIDGGKLTTRCGELWNGIELWGNSELSQLPYSNQGWVQVINGGIIENAICGIKTFRPLDEENGTPMQNYTGGIVQAEDAIFRNNRTAVHFLGYSFINHSYFKNCVFETTATLFDNSDPDYFVKMESVTGIHFNGSKLENKIPPGTIPVERRGSGIYAVDSDIRFESLCTQFIVQPCPAQNTQRSLIKNLYRGIYGISSGPEKTVIVNKADFITNFKGLYLGAMNYATITENYIYPWAEQFTQNPQTYGFYLDQCTGFKMEANEFNNESELCAQCGIGLIINKSGPDNNLVYNNIFKNLRIAAQAQDNNRGKENRGLCYKCNDFVNNLYDIRVTSSYDPIDPYFDGIANHQGAYIPGDNKAPASNVFTNTQQAAFNINNSGNSIIYYKHQIAIPKVHPYPTGGNGVVTVTHVPNTTYTKSESCPSQLTGGSPSEEEALKEEAEAAAEETREQLDELVDGGNTLLLNNMVYTSIPPLAADLHQELLASSPYLSDTVLNNAVGKEEVLVNPMIRDVMVANPHSAKSEELLDMLEQRTEPLPDYMWAEILQGQNISGAKENLEAILAHWNHERYRHWNNLNRHYLNIIDDAAAFDSLVALLLGECSPDAYYQLALLYVLKNNWTEAQSVLNSIPSQFALTVQQQAEHQTLVDYVGILAVIQQASPHTLKPGENQVAVLESLAGGENGTASVYSRNLLIHAGETVYEEPILGDDLLKKSAKKRGGTSKGVVFAQEMLQAYPNPSNGYFVIKTNVPEEGGVVQLISHLGVVSAEYPVCKGPGQFVVNTKELAKGNYMLALVLNYKRAATAKITVQ